MPDQLPPPQPAVAADQELVDTILYLVSLASEIKAIDPELDTMRTVTARWDATAGLNDQDRQALIQVIRKVKDHLIYHDPLREFTAQTLEQRLLERKNGQTQPSKHWLNFKTAIVASISFSLPIVVLPTAPVLQERLLLAVPFFLLLTTICNCWFYLSSMRNFKPELRHAFVYFCVGSVGLGIQFLHFVSIPFFGQEQNSLYKYGGLTIIAALALGAIYIGLRQYVRLLNLSTRFASLGLLSLVLVCSTTVAAGLPYLLSAPQKGYLGFSLASLFALSIMGLWGAGLARAIVRGVTPAYAQSMKRLLLFTAGVCVGALGYALALIIRGELSGQALSAALGVCALPPMLLLLHSGYSFKKETSR